VYSDEKPRNDLYACLVGRRWLSFPRKSTCAIGPHRLRAEDNVPHELSGSTPRIDRAVLVDDLPLIASSGRCQCLAKCHKEKAAH
jgi:hypothetical protein